MKNILKALSFFLAVAGGIFLTVVALPFMLLGLVGQKLMQLVLTLRAYRAWGNPSTNAPLVLTIASKHPLWSSWLTEVFPHGVHIDWDDIRAGTTDNLALHLITSAGNIVPSGKLARRQKRLHPHILIISRTGRFTHLTTRKAFAKAGQGDLRLLENLETKLSNLIT